jgi:hypothetical protein
MTWAVFSFGMQATSVEVGTCSADQFSASCHSPLAGLQVSVHSAAWAMAGRERAPHILPAFRMLDSDCDSHIHFAANLSRVEGVCLDEWRPFEADRLHRVPKRVPNSAILDSTRLN